MITEIRELYRLYQLYKKLTQVTKPGFTITEEYCDGIREQVFAGGCITIKFAQWIISRLRSEPEAAFVVDYFEDIFDSCPYHDLDYTTELFEKIMGKSMRTVVDMSTLTPIASGSIGQVYRARLYKPYYLCPECDGICDGIPHCMACHIPTRVIRDVAIKVKHPGVDKQVADKMKLFRMLSYLQHIKWVKDWLGIHMDMMEFVTNLKIQTDFVNEMRNNHRFRTNFKASRNMIEFPIALDARPDILISEFIETRDMDTLPDFLQLKTCMNYACMVSKMVLIDNFIHADLHHKNWQVSKDDQARLIVFDTGICFASPSLTLNQTIWESFESGDCEKLMDIMDKIIVGPYTDDIRIRINNILDNYRSSAIEITHIMSEINEILVETNCRLSTFTLNILVLLCLIDTTLKKHNLFGNASFQSKVGPEESPRRRHHNFLRTKNLDLIAYIKSRPGAYLDILEYLQDKHERLARTYSDGNISLFGNHLAHGLKLELPE